MQSDDENIVRKCFTCITNIISLISGIITIFSFYGYNNTKQITFIILGISFISLTIFLFINRNKISQHLELKYRKLNKKIRKIQKQKHKLFYESQKATNDFYDTYDSKSIIEFLDFIICNGCSHDVEFAMQFKRKLGDDSILIEDILIFNDLYHIYKNIP